MDLGNQVERLMGKATGIGFVENLGRRARSTALQLCMPPDGKPGLSTTATVAWRSPAFKVLEEFLPFQALARCCLAS